MAARKKAKEPLAITGFTATINGKRILADIDVLVPEKKITAIIGPSGCGKSVLLKSIVGLLRLELPAAATLQYTGKIQYRGKDLLGLLESEMEDIRRRISYISQRPAAFPGDIYENVAFAWRYWNSRRKADLDDIVEEALRRVSLWEYVKDRLNDSPSILSAGQLQKLCIARALPLNPDILLLDEPCAYIDPVSTMALEELFRELQKGATIVIVTHNMQQAARVSENSVFMSVDEYLVGRVVESNSTLAMFTRPEKKGTEDYITGRFG